MIEFLSTAEVNATVSIDVGGLSMTIPGDGE